MATLILAMAIISETTHSSTLLFSYSVELAEKALGPDPLPSTYIRSQAWWGLCVCSPRAGGVLELTPDLVGDPVLEVR